MMIHYHGTPLSGSAHTQTALAARHAMVSFAAPDCVDVVAEVCQSFALDNGAFSAWTRGAEYDVSSAVRWMADWMRHPACDWAIIPDVIDGTEDDNNALLSECMGTGWVPVWHMHESIERLEWLCYDYPRVALGSSGEYASVGDSWWWGRMAEAMEVACDMDGMPVTKLHGLRMLDPTVFSHIPLASADSTNVARNIGIDVAWTGAYAPSSKHTRALILMERIERHASARRWSRDSCGVQRNLELIG